MLRLTAAQAVKVNASICSLCANCDTDGNCLLLSTTELERCPQTQSISLLCKYYIHSVLPVDKELCSALYGETVNKKLCSRCKKPFSFKSNRAKYCPECIEKAHQEADRLRQQKHRINVTL